MNLRSGITIWLAALWLVGAAAKSMPNEWHPSTSRRRYLLMALAVVLVCMTACRPTNPGHGPYYTQFPKDATYMNLRWPAIRDETPAVHFRIPKEDLDISRLRGDKPGQVDHIFLNVRIPEELAKNLYERIPNHGEFKPRPGLPFIREVELLRVPNNAHMRARRFEQWSIDWSGERQSVLKEEVGELTRYSEVFCSDSPQKEPAGKISAANQPNNIRVPEGCYAARANAYLSNSVDIDKGEEGIDIACSADRCNVYLQANGREAWIRIWASQIEYVPELAEIIRNQIKQYIITEGESHGNRGIQQASTTGMERSEIPAHPIQIVAGIASRPTA